MLILLKHILRNIRENKLRSILIILSLAVAAMVLFLNLTIQDDLLSKYTSVLRGAYQEYDLSIKADKFSEDKYFDPKDINLDAIETDKVMTFTATYGIYQADKENLNVLLYGSNRENLMNSSLYILKEKSNDYDSAADDQIVISSKTAKSQKISLNDKIKILTKNGQWEVKVTGIAKVSGLFLSEQDDILFMTTQEFASKAGGVEGLSSNLWISVPDKIDLKQTVDTINKNNQGFLCIELVDEDSMKSSLQSVNQLLIIVLAAVIALNFYVISSITKLIMATRIPVVGTFRSIGATKGKMNFILILENAVYGMIGGVIGIAGGIALRDPLSSLFIYAGDALDYVNVDLKLKPQFILLPLCFSVGLQIIATLSGILKVNRRSIKDTIFNTLRTTARISVRKTILGILLILAAVILDKTNHSFSFLMSGLACIFVVVGGVLLVPVCTFYISKVLVFCFRPIFGGPAALGAKNTADNKTIRSCIVLITVAMALIMTIFTATKSLNLIFTKADKIYTNQIDIYQMEGPEEQYSFLKDLDYVDKVDFAYYSFLNCNINGKDLRIAFLSNSNMMGVTAKDENQVKSLGQDEVLMDQYYASINHLKTGDTITIKSKDLKNEELRLRIAGMVDSYMFTTTRNVIIVTKETLIKNISEIPSVMQVYTSDSPDEVKQKLKEELAGTPLYIQTRKEYMERQTESNQSIMSMISMMLGLSVVLAAFGLTNNQLIGFIQRKKEFAVLYSVSMSKGQLRTMIFFETLSTYIIGSLLGFGLSLGLLSFLEKLLTTIGLSFPIIINIGEMLAILGTVFIILTLTAIAPMIRISRIRVVDEIKYE